MLSAAQPQQAIRLEDPLALLAVRWGFNRGFLKSKATLFLHLWSETPTGLNFKPRFSVHVSQCPPIWCELIWAWVLPGGVFIALQHAQSLHAVNRASAFKPFVGQRQSLFWVSNRQDGALRTLNIWLKAINHHHIRMQRQRQFWWQNWLSLLGKDHA